MKCAAIKNSFITNHTCLVVQAPKGIIDTRIHENSLIITININMEKKLKFQRSHLYLIQNTVRSATCKTS